MRLQNFTIIFVVIALPVIIILSFYIKLQVDTANLRTAYDSTFLGATYDMLSAFQLNTTNNKYSTVSDSLIRDIEASINIFSDNFGNSLKFMGTSKNTVMTYVPAILFTLHDGYYIYTPTANTNGEYEHILKPYIYYTREYTGTNGKIIINYSLDNYAVVYYYNTADNTYESRAGYLEATTSNSTKNGIYVSSDKNTVYYNKENIEKDEELHNKVYKLDSTTGTYKKQDETTTTQRAFDYYLKAYEFTNWYNDIIDKANLSNNEKTILKIAETNEALPEKESDFNNEKSQVIKESIEKNLIQAMETYKKKSGIDFAMPQFTVFDWENIFKEVCVISFIQGLPVGTSNYNNYIILPSSENQQNINDQTLYYIGYGGEADNCYHRLGCEHLKGDRIVGYNKTEFLRQTAIGANGEKLKIDNDYIYYYPHDETACYYCIVNATDSSMDNVSESEAYYKRKLHAYYNALAREKNKVVRLSNYVNGSMKQYIVANAVTEPEEDTNLYNIIIHTDGGGLRTMSGFKYGGNLYKIETRGREGFTLVGHFEQPNGQGKMWYDGDGNPTSTFDRHEDLELYPYWVKNIQAIIGMEESSNYLFSIKSTVMLNDENGNIDYEKCKYVYTKSASELGTNNPMVYSGGSIKNSNSTIEDKIARNPGDWYLHILITFKDGNSIEKISTNPATISSHIDYEYKNKEQIADLLPGKYKLECWGAQGGKRNTTDFSNDYSFNSLGGYTKGDITLENETKLYVYVGEAGSSNGKETFNGGGRGGYGNAGYYITTTTGDTGIYGNSGGGATDFRLTSITENTNKSLRSRIMVAAGGGGSGNYNYSGQNSSAGGLAGYKGNYYFEHGDRGGYGMPGTQTAGGAQGVNTYIGVGSAQDGSFGIGGSSMSYSSMYKPGSGAGGGRRRLLWWWRWWSCRIWRFRPRRCWRVVIYIWACWMYCNNFGNKCESKSFIIY